jgi:hypothetical protein
MLQFNRIQREKRKIPDSTKEATCAPWCLNDLTPILQAPTPGLRIPLTEIMPVQNFCKDNVCAGYRSYVHEIFPH